jgi:hypothetical protein
MEVGMVKKYFFIIFLIISLIFVACSSGTVNNSNNKISNDITSANSNNGVSKDMTVSNSKNVTNVSEETGIETPIPLLEDPDIPYDYISGSGNLISSSRIEVYKSDAYGWSEFKQISEGLIPVKDKGTRLWGFIDINGKYVIEPKYVMMLFLFLKV